MNKTQFSFTGVAKVTMEHQPKQPTSKHVKTDMHLEVSGNLDSRVYLNRGLPTKDAIKPLTLCFIQGLVANIHSAHQQGFWDSAEHLRYIIAELEKGFAEPSIVLMGNMK